VGCFSGEAQPPQHGEDRSHAISVRRDIFVPSNIEIKGSLCTRFVRLPWQLITDSSWGSRANLKAILSDINCTE